MKDNQYRVKSWQALVMIVTAIVIIFLGLKVFEAKTHIILLFDGVVITTLAVLFGIPFDKIQGDMKTTISSMIVAILILIAVGVLVGAWMISGTVPAMIYYGMKFITPKLFLPITCIVCTLMSTMAGTSWGTLATVGVAFMGVASGLGIPPELAAGAIVVGAFFGDKISPLSDSPVLVSSVTDVPLIEGLKEASKTTGLSYLLSLVFFLIIGLRYSGATIGGEVYDSILNIVSSEFNITPLLFIPPLVIVVLLLMKKPTLPTFTAGIFAGIILAIIFQGSKISDISNALYAGYVSETGNEVVDNMLTRGGMQSMLGTVGLLIAAGVFGAPFRSAGVIDILLDFVREKAKSPATMSTGVLILHALFFLITGAYYVSYPVIGSMVKDMFPEYELDKANLFRIMIDTGTGLAPLVPWATTGAYTATTLGVSNLAFLPYAPMLWLSIILSLIMGITGIGMKKLKTIEK